MRSGTLSFGIALVLAAFLFAGSVPVGAEAIQKIQVIDEEISNPFPGITHIHTQVLLFPEKVDPGPPPPSRPLNINVLEVDLNSDDIRFFATPGFATPEEKGDQYVYGAQTTSGFFSARGLDIAVNGDFYAPVNGEPKDVLSLAVSNGVKYSDPGFLPPAWWNDYNEVYLRPALTFTEDGEVYMGRWDDTDIVWDPETDLLSELGDILLEREIYNAVGGNKMLVYEGSLHVDAHATGPAPRTGVGLSEDGETLILMVVDGRQAGFSEGVSLPEMGELLIRCGAYIAMNLDGGGSSTMVLGGAGVINSPSDGAERAVANHLGIVVGDVTPPEINISVAPDELWPPNHDMIAITAIVNTTDNRDANPDVVLTSIVSDEPDNGLGDGDMPNDIQEAALGTDDREFLLRAERSGEGDGRTYVITYTATDASGNSVEGEAAVTVPLEQEEGSGKVVVPGEYALLPNNPNPFNPSTEITYGLPGHSRVQLTVYNARGQEVARLVDREQSAGYHTVVWDASGMSSGVYLCRMEAGEHRIVRKMLLVR